MVLIIVETLVYWFLEPPNLLAYGVIVNLVMTLGWLVTMIIWTKCYALGKNGGSYNTDWQYGT
jgi:hypothetical protein